MINRCYGVLLSHIFSFVLQSVMIIIASTYLVVLIDTYYDGDSYYTINRFLPSFGCWNEYIVLALLLALLLLL